MSEEMLREDRSARVRPLALVPEFRVVLTLTIFWGLLGSVLSIGQMFVLSAIISEVFLFHADMPQTGSWLLWFAGLSVGQALCLLAREVSARHGTIRAQVSLRRRVFLHILRRGPLWMQAERSGELVGVLGEGIERLEAYLARYLPQVILSVLIPLLILLIVFPRDPLSALLLLLTAPLIPLLMMMIGRKAERQSQMQWKAQAHMSAHFLDVVQGLVTLKLFGRSREEQERVARIGESLRIKTMATLRLAFLSGAVLEFLTTMAIGLVAVMLGIRLINHHIALREALFLLLLAPEFYRPLRDLGAARHAGMEGRAAAQRLSELLKPARGSVLFEPAALGVGSLPCTDLAQKSGPLPWRRGDLEIVLRNLGYTYPGSEQPALHNVSLVLPAGSCTALVGRSGAGKSTLARLLLRWQEPGQGEIIVNGSPIEQMSAADWCEYVAFVPQRPYLFYGSIRENILLGRSSASSEEVFKAAELAGALDFILRLPRGFETPVGERGVFLSAGQVQRIALARALLKDAPLLILDEPTSNLDPESEQALSRAIAQLARGRTVLVIAHRLATIAAASRVLVLEQGRIAEVVTPGAWLSQSSAISSWTEKPSRGEVMIEMDTTAPEVRYPGDVFRPTDFTDHQESGTGEILPLPARLRQESVSVESNAPAVSVFWRLCKMQMHLAGPVLLAVLLGGVLVASNLGLLSVAAYLISASSVVKLLALLTLPVFFVRLLGLVRPLARYGERLVAHDVTFRLLARLRTRVYACLEPLAPALFSDYRSGDVLARLVADVDELQHLYLRLFAPLVVALGISLLVFLVLSSFSPMLAWLVLVFLLLAAGVVPLFCRWLARGLGSRQLTLRAELRAVLLDGIQGMPDLLACGQTGPYLQKIDVLDARLSSVQLRQGWIAGLQEALTDLLRQGALWGTLVLAIPLINAGKIDGIYLGSLVFLVLASFEIVPPLARVCQFFDATLAAGRRLFSLLDAAPAVQEPEQPLALPQLSFAQHYDLIFDHIYFSYSRKVSDDRKNEREMRWPWRMGRVGREDGAEDSGGKIWRDEERVPCVGSREILRDITLRVPAGGRVALVGSSGAGKSTLLRLLPRFWDVSSGRILLNGVDIRRYALSDLRALMAVVTQDTYLFNETLRSNLLLARPGASEKELTAALDHAQLGAFVRQLPAGLETRIGEQGIRLSGGERQRLAIARALLKDAPILLLDEVTANLDPRTEQDVFAALHTLMSGRTTLLVTHRLISMERMDEIIVLEDGSIQERGTHAQLLARQGRYAQLWRLQQLIFTSPAEAALVNGIGTGHS